MKVLVVESNQMLRPFISNMLIQNGFYVESTARGSEGVQMFQAGLPSAVILSMKLVDASGLDVLRRMHQINEHIPVIVISTDETIAAAVKMVKAGAYDFIPKSNMTHLTSVIKDAIQIGQTPELVHEKMHPDGKHTGSMIHREYDRIPLRQEVKIDRTYMGKSINISAGGMYIHTGRSHQIGGPCFLDFFLFNKRVQVQGIVRQSEFSVGMGVEFVNLDPGIISAIEQLKDQSSGGEKAAVEDKNWILMISEDSSALRMYKSQFMLSGFSILETKFLDKAAEYLREKKVTCIIIDIDMQSIDARKTIHSIKAVEALSSIPIVAFTSSYKSEAADDLREAGASYFASRMTTPPRKMSEILKKLQTKRL
jgi:DNA-binding NtrC family response regulator